MADGGTPIPRHSTPMRQKLLLLLLAVLAATLPATGYDFEIDGLCYNINDDTTVSVAPGTSLSGNIVIPETVTNNRKTYTVTAIGNNAFANNRNLTGVTIPNSVIPVFVNGTPSHLRQCSLTRS